MEKDSADDELLRNGICDGAEHVLHASEHAVKLLVNWTHLLIHKSKQRHIRVIGAAVP